jgi:hypothetical protein
VRIPQPDGPIVTSRHHDGAAVDYAEGDPVNCARMPSDDPVRYRRLHPRPPASPAGRNRRLKERCQIGGFHLRRQVNQGKTLNRTQVDQPIDNTIVNIGNPAPRVVVLKGRQHRHKPGRISNSQIAGITDQSRKTTCLDSVIDKVSPK